MFTGMKLGTRLALAFGLSLLVSAIAVGVATVQMTAINQEVKELATNWLPSIEVLGEMSNTANAFRRLENQHLAAGSTKEMDEIEGRMVEAKKTVLEVVKKFEAYLATDAEKAAFEELKTRLDAYWKTNTEFVSISRKDVQRHV
jgi:methyl-accepting chemotaxis protein